MLDAEIARIEAAAAAAQSPQGFTSGGWIRTRYANSNDVTVSGNDLGGFNLDNARLLFSAQVSELFGLSFSADGGDAAINDGSSAGLGVVDAYATVELGEIATASVGRFSATYLWNSAYEDRRLFFLDRSFLSEVNDNRDVGVELAGAIDRFNWWAAAQNGSDGAGEELALSARVSCNVLGESLPSSEGCCALGEAEHLTVGAAWYDDGNLDDGTALYGDVAFAKGRWSAIAEIVDFGDDVQPLPGVNSSTGVVIPVGSGALGAETPWDVMLAFMLVPDRWEIGTRWEDLDDDADTTIWTAALNRYFEGHDAKCTLQFSTADSDASANEADTIAVGLTVGI